MNLLLTVLAAVLAIFGVLDLLHGQILWGILLLVLACAVGPGGWSLYRRR
jgi:hypothetical protein